MTFKDSLFSVFPLCLSWLLAHLPRARTHIIFKESPRAVVSGESCQLRLSELRCTVSCSACGACREQGRAGGDLLVLAVPVAEGAASSAAGLATEVLALSMGMGWPLEQRSSQCLCSVRAGATGVHLAGKEKDVVLRASSNLVFHPDENTQSEPNSHPDFPSCTARHLGVEAMV